MVTRCYRVLEHPSDLKLQVFGEDLPDLFCNLVRAIAEEQTDGHSTSVKKEISDIYESIEIESPDLFSLFVDFANEIVYRSDAKSKVYTVCKVASLRTSQRSSSNLSACFLKAKIYGIKADKRIDIKAATYHEGYVKKIDDGWEAVILFDI